MGAVEVETAARRLDLSTFFLGFADAYLYVGTPGWYDNNAGRVVAIVRTRTS